MPGGTQPRFAWGILFSATNNALRLTTGAVTEVLSVAAGTEWFWRGDGSGADAAWQLKGFLDTNTGGGVYTVTLLPTGYLKIDCTLAFQALWAHANTTMDQSIFGFSNASRPNPAGVTVTSDFQVGHYYSPGQIIVNAANATPARRAIAATSQGDRLRVARWGSKRQRREVICDRVAPEYVYQARESVTNTAFERFWDAVNDGTPFEYCPDLTVPGTYDVCQVPEERWLNAFEGEHCVSLIPQLVERYNVRIPLKPYP